jgi:hypothetical protein
MKTYALNCTYGEVLKILDFRLECILNGYVGTVIEDGVEYPMNEYAVFTGKEPRTVEHEGRYTALIINAQIKKRKHERSTADDKGRLPGSPQGS